jgi:hypothetical protein
MTRPSHCSPNVAREIDDEIRDLLDVATTRARTILLERRESLDRMAEALMRQEAIAREQFLALLGPTRLMTSNRDRASLSTASASGGSVAGNPRRRNRRMVSAGPSSASGGSTTFTREPPLAWRQVPAGASAGCTTTTGRRAWCTMACETLPSRADLIAD